MKQNDLEQLLKLEPNYNMMYIMHINSIISLFHRFKSNHILNKMYKHWKTGSVKFKDQALLENLPIKFHTTINFKSLGHKSLVVVSLLSLVLFFPPTTAYSFWRILQIFTHCLISSALCWFGEPCKDAIWNSEIDPFMQDHK